MRRFRTITFVALLTPGVFLLLPAGPAGALNHRNPPAVPNVGTPSKPLRLVAFIPTTFPNATALADFARALPASQWLHALQTAYPVAAGSPANKATTKVFMVNSPLFDLSTPPFPASHTVGDYQDFVFKKMKAAGLGAAPKFQTIYFLFIPCDPASGGMDSTGCISHHPRIAPGRTSPSGAAESSVFTKGDSFAAVLKGTSLDGHTTAATHEMSEAYTNTPGVAQFRLQASDPSEPWMDAQPWVKKSGTVEMADLAKGELWFESDPVSTATDPSGHKTFRYQRVYSTFRSTNGFVDTAVPVSPSPQYGVSSDLGNAPNDWNRFVLGQTMSVKMTAWGPSSSSFTFKVTASVDTSGGADSNFCSLPTTTWTVHNNDTFHLVVNPPTLVLQGTTSWCTIALVSKQVSPPPSGGDESHLWKVGIINDAPSSNPT